MEISPRAKQAIARIDFIAPLEALETSLPPKLGKSLTQIFPIAEPEPTPTFFHEVQIAASAVQHRQMPFNQWNFYGKNREKQLALADRYIFVTYTTYTTFEDMKEDFTACLNALHTTFADVKAGRFGLRHINQIEIAAIDPIGGWGEFINPELLATDEFFFG